MFVGLIMLFSLCKFYDFICKTGMFLCDNFVIYLQLHNNQRVVFFNVVL